MMLSVPTAVPPHRRGWLAPLSVLAATLVLAGGCVQTRDAGQSRASDKKPVRSQGAEEESWIADATTGCKVWNRLPQLRSSITWSGACSNGLAEGSGKRIWLIDGTLYESYSGTMKAGKRHGDGIVERGGSRYAGQFRDDWETGTGTKTYQDGSEYRGEWLKGLRHGKGTETRREPNPRHALHGMESYKSYVGGWVSDHKEGQGVMEWWDGRRYVGEFRVNRLEGQGTMTWPSGEKYTGAWKDDWKKGRGLNLWPARSCVGPSPCLVSYDGEHRRDSRNGFGVGKWSNGDSYEGEWRDDEPVGRTVRQARADKERMEAEERENRRRPPSPSYQEPPSVSVPYREYKVAISCRGSAFSGKPYVTLTVPVQLQHEGQLYSVLPMEKMTEICERTLGSGYYRGNDRIVY